MLGKLLGTATRVVNTPLEVADKVMSDKRKLNDDDRTVSSPLEHLAESLDDADKAWNKE